jgi:hypothetical protein
MQFIIGAIAVIALGLLLLWLFSGRRAQRTVREMSSGDWKRVANAHRWEQRERISGRIKY